MLKVPGDKKPFVADAEGHVDEPNSMWPHFLDKKYQHRTPVTKVEPDGYPRLEIEGSKALKIAKPPPGSMSQRKTPLGGVNPIERLKDMDMDGVDAAVPRARGV